MFMRSLYLLFCGLILGGIIHIVIILLIPSLGSRDAARQIGKLGNLTSFQYIENGSKVGIANIDPFFKLSVCRFDLERDGLLVSGTDAPTYWSASVFDDEGRVIYSLNDRTAIKNRLQMIVVNPIQMADLRQAQPEEIETSIVVETTAMKGFVLLRVLVRDPSWEERARNFLDEASCQPFETR